MADTRFTLYIVRCASGTLYTGIATDVAKRFEEHQGGKRGAKYLRGRGPLELVFSAEVGDRARASRLEYRVKKLTRAEKLSLIEGHLALDDLGDDQVLEEVCA